MADEKLDMGTSTPPPVVSEKEAEAVEGSDNATGEESLSSPSHSVEKFEGTTRDTFSNKIDFLMACVGYSVGLGNFWRFPYLCYKNGGGAFLIPYFLMVVLAGIPMFFIEVAIGQFMSSGGIKVWNISPFFTGIGFATTIIVFFLNVYYNVIMAWAFYYFFASFTSRVPWSHCDNDYNTPRCRVDWNKAAEKNITALLGAATNSTNSTGNATQTLTYYNDAVTEFWQRKVLGLTSGIDEPGPVKWDLALCLLLAWIVVFVCISKGVKSSGKVMYVTATTPYIFMIILLVRGCTLPGAGSGIIYYLKPTTERLLKMETWVDAGTQIFFSYSIGIGATTTLGSFNKFHHNSLRDSVIFAGVNSGTSFLAGFVIFAVLGYMADEQNISIDDVAESGPGLAFIAYPKALAAMPISPLWSVFFFLMVILLGLDSEFVAQEGLVATIVDLFPGFFRKAYRKVMFTAVACVLCFLVGLSMVTGGGLYLFQIFDFYSGSRIILLVAFFECIAVAWAYGIDRFLDNLAMMYGFRFAWLDTIMKWTYLIVAPATVLAIFIINCISYTTLSIKFSSYHTYEYPEWAITIGWLMACSSIMWVPIVMVYKIAMMLRTSSTYWDFFALIRPKLLPHHMRPHDDPRDINPDARLDNVFLPKDLLELYDGSLENYVGSPTPVPSGYPNYLHVGRTDTEHKLGNYNTGV